MMYQTTPLRSADPDTAGGGASPAKPVGLAEIKTELSPEIGAIRALARKVNEWWTSKMHSSRHLDNLTKIANTHSVVSSMYGQSLSDWQLLSNSAPQTLKKHISAASHPVGKMLKDASKDLMDVCQKLSEELQGATGSTLSFIRQDRRYMNNEERAKISTIYRSHIGAYTAAEGKFNSSVSKIIDKLKSVTNSVATLLKTEKSVREELETNAGLAELENNHVSGISAALTGYYEAACGSIFAKFSAALAPEKEPTVDTVSTEAQKATAELQSLQGKFNGVIATAHRAVQAKESVRVGLETNAELAELERNHFPGISAALKGYYEAACGSIFAKFSAALAPEKEPTVDTVSAEAGKATTELESLSGKFNGVIATAHRAAQAKAYMQATANCLVAEQIPSDVEAAQVVRVSEDTFNAVQTWFDEKREKISKETLAKVANAAMDADVLNKPEQLNAAVEALENDVKQQREMIQGIARAVQPLMELLDPGLSGDKKQFTDTLEGCKYQIELAAREIMRRYPHELALKKLEALRQIASEVREGAKAELASLDGLTKVEGLGIQEDLNREIDKIFRKSWTPR